jgi:hypothetical protein
VPVHVEVPVVNWWDYPQDHWMHIRWEVAGGEKGESWCFEYAELNIPGTGRVRVQVDLEWVAGKEAPWNAADRRVEDRASRVLEYDVVDSLEDAMSPVSSAALDSVLSSTLVANRNGMLDGPSYLLAKGKLPPDVSFGLKVEFILDGLVIGTSHARFVGGSAAPGSRSGPDFLTDKDYDKTLRLLEEPRLKARVVTDRTWVLHNIDATKYWKGEVDIALAPPPPPATRLIPPPASRPLNPAKTGSSSGP